MNTMINIDDCIFFPAISLIVQIKLMSVNKTNDVSQILCIFFDKVSELVKVVELLNMIKSKNPTTKAYIDDEINSIINVLSRRLNDRIINTVVNMVIVDKHVLNTYIVPAYPNAFLSDGVFIFLNSCS